MATKATAPTLRVIRGVPTATGRTIRRAVRKTRNLGRSRTYRRKTAARLHRMRSATRSTCGSPTRRTCKSTTWPEGPARSALHVITTATSQSIRRKSPYRWALAGAISMTGPCKDSPAHRYACTERTGGPWTSASTARPGHLHFPAGCLLRWPEAGSTSTAAMSSRPTRQTDG